jgi:hypothetical protein
MFRLQDSLSQSKSSNRLTSLDCGMMTMQKGEIIVPCIAHTLHPVMQLIRQEVVFSDPNAVDV